METHHLEKLLRIFGKAFFRADNKGLRSCTTSDFEWHQHTGSSPPDGKVIRGVDSVCEDILWRKQHWRDVRYDDFENIYTPSLITSTFRVSGYDENDRSFNVRAVDLYYIQDGKISRKDSFWKQVTAE